MMCGECNWPMEKIKYKSIIDSNVKLQSFGYGEWVEEADEATFNYKEIDCRIHRNDFGSLCGYCKIPENHSWFEKSYDDIDVDIHGGLTFAQKEEDGYWIGFDCSHYGDISPVSERIRIKGNDLFPIPEHLKHQTKKLKKLMYPTYKNMAFCIEECKKMADQILEAAKVKT